MAKVALKWGYDERDGPDMWGQYLKVAGRPFHGQSPIDIERENCVKANWRRLRFRYKRDRCQKIKNNGHTFMIDVAKPEDLENPRDFSLRRGPLKDDRYALAKIKFHWGPDNEAGSEHTVDGRQFPAEAHLIHFNMKYPSFSEAKMQHDGLAIVAVLFEVGEPNKGVDSVLGLLENIKYKGDKVDLEEPFYPKWLLPRVLHRQKFWHYYGSLTSPPCAESVNWIVFMKPLTLSEEQLDAFREMRKYCKHCEAVKPWDEHDGRIMRNFRTVQPKAFTRTREEDEEEEEFERPVYSYIRRRRRRRYVKEEGDSESSSSSSSDSDESNAEDSNEEDSE